MTALRPILPDRVSDAFFRDFVASRPDGEVWELIDGQIVMQAQPTFDLKIVAGNLERLLKQAGQQAPERKPILEINPQHPLVKQLRAETTARFDDWSSLLFDQALLAEGGKLDDPSGFVKRMNDLLLALTMAPAGWRTDQLGEIQT